VPTSSSTLSRRAVACVLDQLARRLRLRHTRVSDDEERARARLSHAAHLRLSLIGVINSDTGISVYGTLRSLEAAERLGPTPERANAYSMICGAAALIPLHGLARYYGRRAMRTLEMIGSKDTLDRAAVLNRLAFHANGAADWDAAYAQLVQSRDLSARFGDWTEWGISVQMLGRWAAHQGRYEDLARWSQELLESAQRRGVLVEQAWAYNNLAEAELATRGDSERVREYLEHSLAIGADTGNVTADSISRALHAHLDMQRGHWPEAFAAAHASLELISSHQETSYGTLIAYQATAEVLLACWESRSGDVMASRAAASRACQLLNRMARVFPVAVPRALRVQAHHDWLAGRERNARRAWRRALHHAERLGMTHDIGWTLFELGRHTDSPEGQRQLERALAIFEQLGARRDLARARMSLSQAEARVG
jgi:tetratricopeptide (TPR) repeat protein